MKTKYETERKKKWAKKFYSHFSLSINANIFVFWLARDSKFKAHSQPRFSLRTIVMMHIWLLIFATLFIYEGIAKSSPVTKWKFVKGNGVMFFYLILWRFIKADKNAVFLSGWGKCDFGLRGIASISGAEVWTKAWRVKSEDTNQCLGMKKLFIHFSPMR